MQRRVLERRPGRSTLTARRFGAPRRWEDGRLGERGADASHAALAGGLPSGDRDRGATFTPGGAAEQDAAQPPHDERRGALNAKVDADGWTGNDAGRAVGCGRELHRLGLGRQGLLGGRDEMLH